MEVKKFLKLKIQSSKTAHKAIGIQEIKEFLNKKIEISEDIERISIKTRQYAKRQLKWFDAQEFNIVIDADDINSDDMVDKITQIC